jgi:hypothetical protein
MIIIDTKRNKFITDQKDINELLAFIKENNVKGYNIEVKEDDNKVSFGNFKKEK